ncbi:MAG: UDP-4-amino-4,6-dideoxy-N-acetyl-beta-L-altrosamine transaminase [Sphingosinicella sp.]
MIPYGRQDISDEDVEAVVAALRSDFLTQGPAVPAFEQALAAYCGAQHAVAVNSATSALHIACLALGVGPGDLVWTSPITFVATANCALYCGAEIDFVDIDPRTFNLSGERLEEKLVAARRAGRLPKVVIPVHLAGQSCDMAAIGALAERYGFKVIEDASHAVGAGYRGEPVGNCRYSDIAIFSFHPVKIITTAEGGLALTNDAGLARKMALLRTHGVTRDEAQMEKTDGPWYYEQQELGFNYRMTDIQAALGLSQTQRLDRFIAARRAIAARYDEALNGQPLTCPWQHPDTQSSWHLYIVRLDLTRNLIDQRLVFEQLRAAGIGVNLHYIPVHLQPYYRRLGFRAGQFPEAEQYYRKAVTLPLYPALGEKEQAQVVEALADALNQDAPARAARRP